MAIVPQAGPTALRCKESKIMKPLAIRRGGRGPAGHNRLSDRSRPSRLERQPPPGRRNLPPQATIKISAMSTGSRISPGRSSRAAAAERRTGKVPQEAARGRNPRLTPPQIELIAAVWPTAQQPEDPRPARATPRARKPRTLPAPSDSTGPILDGPSLRAPEGVSSAIPPHDDARPAAVRRRVYALG